MNSITFHPSSSKSHTFRVDRITELEREGDELLVRLLVGTIGYTMMAFESEDAAKDAQEKIAKAMDGVMSSLASTGV